MIIVVIESNVTTAAGPKRKEKIDGDHKRAEKMKHRQVARTSKERTSVIRRLSLTTTDALAAMKRKKKEHHEHDYRDEEVSVECINHGY